MKEQKNKFYIIRLTTAEYEKLNEMAKERGVLRSAFLRSLLFDTLPPRKDVADALQQTNYEINRVGNCINQIAHKWNADGGDGKDIKPLEAHMAMIYKTLRDINEQIYKRGRKNGNNKNTRNTHSKAPKQLSPIYNERRKNRRQTKRRGG